VFVVTVTPFHEDGRFDEAGTHTLLNSLVEEGVTGIVLAGSTGEWFTMSDDERIELFRVGKEVVAGRIPVLAGISAIATKDSVKLASKARDLGLDGALLLPPPYVLPTDRELDAYIAAIAEVGLPIMLYNNPARTGVNLDVRWLRRLSRHPSIVAVKESTKDVHQLSATMREVGGELAVFTGMETYLSTVLQRGGAGVVAMAPNLFGSLTVDLYRALREGDVEKAGRLQDPIDRLYARMYAGTHNPYVVLKEGMRVLGRPGGYPRLPLLGFEPDEREEFAAFLRSIKQ
jgi:4-hydroxy-tetrahydrodipicolinate synthase